jgi:TRAP-type C4-dicarboxylate transport system permease small subunit
VAEPGASRAAPAWFQAADRALRLSIMWICCTLLVLMVAFTVYTVVMRYVFKDPPFWGDTVSLFCNIWLVLIAYSLAVRDREDISSEAIYMFLPARAVSRLRSAWQIMTFAFAVYLIWFGLDAALNVPGQFWELGGLPKTVPMLALPLCGTLVALVTASNLAEDMLGWRQSPHTERTHNIE